MKFCLLSNVNFIIHSSAPTKGIYSVAFFWKKHRLNIKSFKQIYITIFPWENVQYEKLRSLKFLSKQNFNVVRTDYESGAQLEGSKWTEIKVQWKIKIYYKKNPFLAHFFQKRSLNLYQSVQSTSVLASVKKSCPSLHVLSLKLDFVSKSERISYCNKRYTICL